MNNLDLYKNNYKNKGTMLLPYGDEEYPLSKKIF